ncbi:E3 ubiquitin-protein ligase hrd1 [Podila humilis]|nr:E3 ubiquitin-protein ligase hrd1 [Podila humilis]
MARLAVYGAISAALAGCVIATAFAQRSNFYAACIYLYKSNACMMIILNLGLFLTIIAGQLVQMIFFGNLRTLEVEHLYERAWYAVTETCLAMTIFKDDFNTLFVVMFTFLLFLKVFHWLCQDRVDSMEQSPEIPMSFHIRMVTMIALLVTIDVLMVMHAATEVMTKEPNMMIMFGFEYMLLVTNLMASFGKYVLHTIDMRREEPWENKSMLLFYLDLVADFVKLVTYLVFFMVILITSGLPLHIIRDVYMTMRSFIQKCKDLIQYRKATQNMNERYPDASAEELAALSDPICIICREEMAGQHPVPPPLQPAPGQPPAAVAGAVHGAALGTATPRSGSNSNVPKKLPCGHIFHFHCLKSWLERQQSCPTCRRLVLDPPTPAPTPVQAGQGGAAGAGTAGPGAAAGVAGGAVAEVAGAGAGPGQNPQPYFVANGHLHHPTAAGFPRVFAPQGHYPLAGWHPHWMANVQGAPNHNAGVARNDAASTSFSAPGTATTRAPAETGGSSGVSTAGAGTGVDVGSGAHIPAATPFIPHFCVPHVTHPIPGLIPLFPVQAPRNAFGSDAVSEARESQGQEANASEGTTRATSGVSRSTLTSPIDRIDLNSLATDQIPLTSLEELSDIQIAFLEQNTRRGLQERLRILQAVELQIIESMSVLTQAIGALPPSVTNANLTSSAGCKTYSDSTTTEIGITNASDDTGTVAGHSELDRSLGLRSNGASALAASLQSLTKELSPSSMSDHDATTSGMPLPSESVTTSPLSTAMYGDKDHDDDADHGDGDEQTRNITALDKGKGKMKAVEVIKEKPGTNVGSRTNGQTTESAGLVSGVKDEEEGEYGETSSEEDGKYSPQEMVRRRWAKVSVAESAAKFD